MNPEQATIKLSFDKATSGLVSVKIRVSYRRDRRRYAFPIKQGVLVTESDFDRLVSYHQTKNKRTADEVKNLYTELEPYLEKAEQLVERLIPFSFDAFRDAFYSNNAPSAIVSDAIGLMNEKATRLDQEDQVSNADNYSSSAHSLSRFLKSLSVDEQKEIWGSKQSSDRLPFELITPLFLRKYERWMLQYGKAPRSPTGSPTPASLTTISIYTRNLRSIYNEAIEKGLAKQENYPFGKKGYTIPASVNTKKALSKSDVLKLVTHQGEMDSLHQRGKDFWVFSYLCNGMNLADIFRLRWSDVDLTENTVTFIRKKTTQTRKAKQVKIVATLFPESLAIIERWGNPKRGTSDYLFSFLEDGMSARRQKEVIGLIVKSTNKYVDIVAKELEIPGDITTYAARHSFATILLRSEAPIAFISQSLGHTSLKTTEDYLGSFEDEQTKKYLSHLL